MATSVLTGYGVPVAAADNAHNGRTLEQEWREAKVMVISWYQSDTHTIVLLQQMAQHDMVPVVICSQT